MANVNEQAYGSKDLWYSISYSSSDQFPASVPTEERNMLANFTDTIPSSIDWHLQLGRVIYEVEVNGNQTLKDLFYNTVFDRSICFVGQSGKSSYTSIRFFDNHGTDSQNPDVHELPTQTYDVVNLAFSNGLGAMRDYGNNTRSWRVIGADIDKDPSGNPLKFDAIRWNPLGWAGIQGTNDYYTSYGNRNQTTFVTNLGVKRNVLVPYIKAGPTDTSDENAIQTYDLATYLSTYKDSKPYVYSIGFETTVMYGENIEASSSNRRIQDSSYNLMLMEYIGSLNDFYYIGPNSEWQTVHYNNDLFVPQTLRSPHMPIGGYINNGSHNAEAPSTLGYESTLNSVDVHGVIDCNDIKWDTWVNVGGSTAEGTCNKILVADARKYTEEEFREAVRHSLACFGMFFADSVTVAQEGKLDDPNMHLGTLKNGIGYGDYTSGKDNRKQPQWNWDSMSENDYDPSSEPDIPDDSEEDTKNKTVLPSRGMLMPFTGSYVFDYLALTGVINACTNHYIDMQDAIEDWNLNKEEYEDSLDFESYLWRQWGRQANPVDCLQNITYYPFDIRPYMTGLTTTTVIQVGSFVKDYTGTGVIGSKVGATTTAGSIWCGAGENSGMKFPITDANDFRSYAPYVSATLYLPFCGSIDLDPQVFVGHSIKVNYLVDWRTGVCLALVYRDNLVVEAVSGQMGNKVNLQMLDGTTWASQLANASVQESNAHFNRATNFFATVGGLVKIAAGTALIVGSQGTGAAFGGGSLITSGIGSVANGFVKGNQIDVAENKAAYDIGTTPIPTRQISTASPAVNASNEMRVRLVVFKSDEESSSNYAHTVGHACLKYGTLKNLKCTGYTVCQTIDTAGITATEAEKEKIRSLLMGGVYV